MGVRSRLEEVARRHNELFRRACRGCREADCEGCEHVARLWVEVAEAAESHSGLLEDVVDLGGSEVGVVEVGGSAVHVVLDYSDRPPRVEVR